MSKLCKLVDRGCVEWSELSLTFAVDKNGRRAGVACEASLPEARGVAEAQRSNLRFQLQAFRRIHGSRVAAPSLHHPVHSLLPVSRTAVPDILCLRLKDKSSPWLQSLWKTYACAELFHEISVFKI